MNPKKFRSWTFTYETLSPLETELRKRFEYKYRFESKIELRIIAAQYGINLLKPAKTKKPNAKEFWR